jgi:SNF2 family DNA or RNA helicase
VGGGCRAPRRGYGQRGRKLGAAPTSVERPQATGRDGLPEALTNFRVDGQAIAVRVGLDAGDGTGWQRLLLRRVEGFSPPSPTAGSVPGAGEQGSDRLAAAARWIIEMDAGAKADLLAGREIGKAVPIGERPPIPTPSPQADADAYRELRPSLGELVRPLLIDPPTDDALLPYQRDGLAWLLGQEVAILADDMGLGKTLQAISAIRHLACDGKARCALVVAPRTILATWEDELARWAPELTRLRVTPSATARESVWRALVGRVHVLITNYEQLREPPEALTRTGVDVIVADEAHRIRNLRAAVTGGMRRVRFGRFWALTGTPIERDTEDLATLLSILAPARFSPSDARLHPATLRRRARPYILRRTRSEVLRELPEVIDSKETLELTPPQRRAYEAAKRRARPSREAAETLQLINELRTICDYAPGGKSSSKLERIGEHLLDIRERGEKAVVFSTLLEPLRILQQDLSKEDPPISAELITGEMTSVAREDALRRFRDDGGATVLLASMRAAGEGLTLTVANHVLFVSEWWNPSANQQARDRVVRIGQTRGVRVYRFMCRETIEETLEHILARKSEIYREVVDRLTEGGVSDVRTRELLNEVVAAELGRS